MPDELVTLCPADGEICLEIVSDQQMIRSEAQMRGERVLETELTAVKCSFGGLPKTEPD